MYNNTNLVLGLLLVLISLLCTSNAASDVVTQNLKLYVEGQEFFIKALCYSPVPLGQGVGLGGGFCSPKTTPFGDVETTCYDSDYFDGGGDAVGRSQPTQGGWFQPIWERDFPIMKSLGANTLRLYSANPTTKQASIYYPEVVPLPLGKDHVPFMDMAQVYGFKIIFPLISDYGMMTTYSVSTFKRLLRWQIDEIGNHPALLMWAFGNELPLYGNQALVNTLNMYITYIKQYTYTKWGRRVPVTTAVVDLPQSYDYLAANLDVDVFTTNAGYRGFTFTDLWAGNTQTQGWYKLSCRYNKPVFIGEMGWLSLNSLINTQFPNWFNQMWKDLIAHIDQGCIGGAFFEYSDERLKADVLQQTMGIVQLQVNTTGGLLSTAAGVWNADLAVPKNNIFDSVKSGSYNGVFYNMNSSPFYLAGRAPTLLSSSSADICASFGMATCPAQNTCSFKGICDRQSGLCNCDAGWTGADCSQATCTSGCSGLGTCVNSVSPPVCACQAGWTGPSCSVQATQVTCATNCVSGNGNCDVNGNCVCHRGWWGHDCGIPDISYPPITTASTPQPTILPTTSPSVAPTKPPTGPTAPPTSPPTTPPTSSPTTPPTSAPTKPPTSSPTKPPTSSPTTKQPTQSSTVNPTIQPTGIPTGAPTAKPTTKATSSPTTTTPTTIPPSPQPTGQPTSQPTGQPTSQPTGQPTSQPTAKPTVQPTFPPSVQPTTKPTIQQPTQQPTQPATVSSRCGTMQSCGDACFNPQIYSCYDGLLCPISTLKCGPACYDPNLYTCNSNQLMPK